MNNRVTMRKRGKFYSVYESDAYVLHALLKYKVIKNRVGFPIETIGKVTNMLEENKVNYIVIDNDEEIIKRYFPNNNYEKFVKKGKELCSKTEEEKQLVDRIMKLDEEKVNLILEFIKEVAYSG